MVDKGQLRVGFIVFVNVSSVCHREHSRHQIAIMMDLDSFIKVQEAHPPAFRSVVFL